MTNSTVSGNAAGTVGGGIYNGKTLTLNNSTVIGNQAANNGGGIYNGGTATLTNSTVSGNQAANDAGGIFNTSGNTLNLTGVTVTNNHSTNSASITSVGGIRNAGVAALRNTIVAGNTKANAASSSPDFRGSVTATSSYNLIGNGQDTTGIFANDEAFNNQVGTAASPIDPKLAPLANNGGATQTHALQVESPAIDKGNSFGLTNDQRGLTRPVDNPSIMNANNGDGGDIGAFEVAYSPPSTLSISGVISFGTAPAGQPKFVSGVLMNATGATSTSANSDVSGAYLLDNLTSGGNYTVTPSKSGEVNGITSFDATLVLRCVAAGGGCTLTNNQKLAADTDNNNSVTSFDATQILRYVAAGASTAATGQIGNWKFNPASRDYVPLSGSLSNENYEAILVGEISGDWIAP